MRIQELLFVGLVFCLCLLGPSLQAQDEIVAIFQKTSTPPVIDGDGDEDVWAIATAHTTDEFFVTAGEPLGGPGDLDVSWKALWDDQNLYVLVEVADDELVYNESFTWEDDSVEIYIDAQNTDALVYNPHQNPGVPAYQFTVIAGQKPLADTTSLFTMGANSYADLESVVQYPRGADVGGMMLDEENRSYSFEVAFPWEALEETPANIIARGDEGFGFGVAINDDDIGGTRDTQVMWATESGELWQIAQAFPSVRLEGGVVCDPGDFNCDGMLDAQDIDDLTAQSATGTNPADYDLNADALVNGGDVTFWIKNLYNSWVGDANLDGEFNTNDLVTVLASGVYEQDANAVWSTGDFNGDGRTNSGDLVAALSDGGYEAGVRPATAAVPEPASFVLLGIGLLPFLRRRR